MRILAQQITYDNLNRLKKDDVIILLYNSGLGYSSNNSIFERIWIGKYDNNYIRDYKYTSYSPFYNVFVEHVAIPCDYFGIVTNLDYTLLHITDEHSIQLLNLVNNSKSMFKLINEIKIYES